MTSDNDIQKSNIVYPLLFRNDEEIKSRVKEMTIAESKSSPVILRNLIAVKVFCGLGIFALILSAIQPARGGELTWISGFLMLSGALCFGIATIYRFSKDFWK